eukprot:5170283-Pyramimonas_sp.AAC.1
MCIRDSGWANHWGRDECLNAAGDASGYRRGRLGATGEGHPPNQVCCRSTVRGLVERARVMEGGDGG